MNDPVKGCDVYKNIGCAHVDGFLCDYPNCSILKDYKMNERIQELAEQADLHATLYFRKEQLRKFAELIVRECGEWVNDNLGLLDEEAKSDLLKHFGVEE
jgi:hypothetical protein